MKNIVTRYMTAAIALPLLLALLLMAPSWAFHLALSTALLLALYEWVVILNRMNLHVPGMLSLILGGILLGSLATYGVSDEGRFLLFGFFLCMTGICLYRLLRPGQDLQEAAGAMSAMLFVILMVCWGGGSLMLIREFSGKLNGSHMVIFLLCFAWAGDAGALHVGKAIGKRKLSPVISPNKTIAGFVGAIVSGTAVGGIAYLIFQFPFPWWHVLIMGPALVILTHTGDLTESVFKRGAQVKDSGTLIPGHGGFLDRLDNILLTSPFMYLYVTFFLGV